MSRLQQLPLEVLLPILCHLSIADIACCQRLARFFNDTVNAHAEIIYKAIAESSGYTKLCTAGDSGIAVAEEHKSVTLEKAVKNQKCALGSFDGCKTWRQLVRKRKMINDNWTNLRYTKEQLISELPMWSFKIDTDDRRVVTSLSTLGNIAWAPMDEWAFDPELRMQAMGLIDAPAHSHVELSNGFLVTLAGHVLTVYKATKYAIQHHKTIHLPNAFACYKARYPFVAAVSDLSFEVRFYELETGNLVQSIPIPRNDRLGYTNDIEFDGFHVYVALDGDIQVYSRSSGMHIGNLPRPNPKIDWTKVRHTRNHIVVIDTFGSILIICRNGSDIPWDNFENAAVTAEIYYRTGLTQLSIENGRCVFVAVQHNSLDRTTQQALFLFELPIFSCMAEFEAQKPKIKVLEEVCPTGAQITCVEQDGSAVYVTYHNPDLESNARVCAHFKRWQKLKSSIWRNVVTDERIGDCYNLMKTESTSTATLPEPTGEDWSRNSANTNETTPDRVYVYSFGDTE